VTEPKRKFALGKLDAATAALFACWRLAGWLMPGSALTPIIGFAFFATAAAAALRWLRILLHQAIWRLRNRLLLSYVFIAVVPVLLLGILGTMGARILSEQVAAYIVTQAFQQDLDILSGTARGTLRAWREGGDPEVARVLRFVGGRFEGMQAVLTDGSRTLRLPENGSLDHPAREMASIVLKDGLLYTGVHFREGPRRITILAPITKAYLQALVPNLGDISLIHWRASAQTDRMTMRLHGEPVDADSRAIAPPVNVVDYDVLWGMPLAVFAWDRADADVQALLGVHTRISQVFRVIFSQKADWDQSSQIYLFYGLALAFLLVELVALVIGIAITRTMTRAVHYLHESTERVQAGDFSYRIPVQGDDQLADLSRSYNTMIENLDRLLKVAKENERHHADLRIAKEVQEQLYPRTVPQVEGLQITAMLRPAKSVSGDYYDYQRIDDHRVTIAIGDVAGKGVSAAILMANVQSAMRAQLGAASGGDICTATTVSRINKHLEANTSAEKYSTFFFAVYDQRTAELTATNAGHLPPILLRNGEATRLDVNGMVVGVLAHAEYDQSKIVLEPGDLLVLYTDGITEPENEYGEMFGEERMIEAVLRSTGKSNEEILTEIFTAVQHWTYSPDSADDMTMMIVRRV
jgi:phosphoserine phosphatase RsbU/P